MPVIVLYGDEELLMSERFEALKEELLDPSWSGFNFSRQVKPDLRQIIDASAQIPFGPGNKVIAFEQCEFFARKRSSQSDDDDETGDSGQEAELKSKSPGERDLKDFENALAGMSANTYLIFCLAKFEKTMKLSKIVEKHAASIEEFKKLKFYAGSENPAILNWCRKRAHKHGAVIDDEASYYLAESAAGDLRSIAAEIEKAAVFLLPEKRITLNVVSELSPHHSETFALLDNWLSGDRRLVLSGIQEVLSGQQSALPVFALTQYMLSKWLQVKHACERVKAGLPSGPGLQRRGLPVAEMAKRLQGEIGGNPWVLKMDLERVQKVKLEFLVNKKKELTRLEHMLKTGRITEINALTIFFTTDGR